MRALSLLLTLILSLGALGAAHAQDVVPPGRIAFTSDHSGVYQIYVANADGSDLQQITQVDYAKFLPLWSPDGKRLLYLESTTGEDLNTRPVLRLMLTDLESGAPVEVARDPEGGFVMNPARYLRWSPDGERVVYGIFTDDERGQHVRYFVDELNGNAPIEVASPEAGEDIGYAQFLDDETLLVTAGVTVYRTHLDGSEAEMLIEFVGVPVALSPDRQHIASVSGGELTLYDANGQNPSVLIEDMSGPVDGVYVAFAYDLIWSPDGEWLSGTARLQERLTIDGTPDPTPETPLPEEALFTVRADGSDYSAFLAADLILSWSPDSRQIAYTIEADGHTRIAVAPPDGSNPHIIGYEGGSAAQPAWQP